MARTQLFARLRALLSRDGENAPHAADDSGLSRREFVEQVMLGLGALAATSAATACDGEHDNSSGAGDELDVVVIGAGMAGLMCTHQVEEAGLSVGLFEASERFGGRMYSVRDKFPDAQVAELGGELVDTQHTTLHMLAKKYGIQLDDRDAAAKKDTRKDVWWVEGKAVPEDTIVAQFKQVAPLMFKLMQQADDENDDTVYKQLDKISMQTWLDDNLKAQPELKSVLTNAYRGEYGLELDEQSVLNLIYLIGSDDPDPFRIFGTSDERYHTHTGSQTFPEKVAGELKTQVQFKHELVKVADDNGLYSSTFKTASGELTVKSRHVVFALPFTMLRKVDLTKLPLSDLKRTIIKELGYGTNVKVMGSFTERIWLTKHNALGSITADEPFQQSWDTSLGQAGASGLLTNFLGGKQGEKSGQGTAEDWYQSVMVVGAEKVFPGAKAVYVKGTAVRMHWPTQPFTLGSYACYKPGQWAFYGHEGESEGDNTIHFCGEHTSVDFQGYMEGAAETGALVATAILEQEGKKASAFLQALMHLKRSVPQPSLGEHPLPSRHRERTRLRMQMLRELASLGRSRASLKA